MQFSSGQLYHVYNRGNNKQDIFFEEDNYKFFLGKVVKELGAYADLLGYCLMPNHYHLLICVRPSDLDSASELSAKVSRKIGTIQSSYTRAINKRFHRTGSLFQQKAKAKNVEMYGLVCLNYIHQNPVRAGFCYDLNEWKYCSYGSFVGTNQDGIVDTEMALHRLELPTDSIEFANVSRQGIDCQELNIFL